MASTASSIRSPLFTFDFSTYTPRHCRILGALLGVHAGDSLGATLEFTTHKRARSLFPSGHRSIIGGGVFNWHPGDATDDTDLTRAVLLAYVDEVDDKLPKAQEETKGQPLACAAGNHMLDWLDGDPRDIGGATLLGLSKYRETEDPLRAGVGEGQAGNGSLMRCIPTALFTTDSQARRELSIEISSITHDDARCTLSCVAYNEIVVALIAGSDPETALQAGEEALKKESYPAARDVAEALRKGRVIDLALVARSDPAPLVGKCGGYVLESLTLAVAALLDRRGIVDVLADIVSIGADADTNAAIAGGLLGARDGVEAIPKEWLKVLQFATEFVQVVNKIVAANPALQ